MLISGNVAYLSQLNDLSDFSTVAELAELAGLKEILLALQRIQAGSTSLSDFDQVNDCWNIAQRFDHLLKENDLRYLNADTPAHFLSGGERTRIALLGLMLIGSDLLILDEPTNHLDSLQRQNLLNQLDNYCKGMLIISHDRGLLDRMDYIFELSSHGLERYGGNYSFYAEAKRLQRQTAEA